MTNLVLSYLLICLSLIISLLLILYLFRKNKKLIDSNKEDCQLFVETLTASTIDLICKENELKEFKKRNEELRKEEKELLEENRNLFNKNKKLEEKLNKKNELLSKKFKLIYYYKNKYGKSTNQWRKKS